MKFKNIALSIVPLIIGGMLYLGYRSQELSMFNWIECLGLSNFVTSWRLLCSQYPQPMWIYNSLPDGLWLFSYILLMDIIWNNNINQSGLWIYILPVVAIISEFMQLWTPFPGTFDIIDIVCYSGSILLFELKTRIKWKRKDN